MTLIYAMALGANCIDDCDVLRSGRLAALLGRVVAPSTLGTFCARLPSGMSASSIACSPRPPHAHAAHQLRRRRRAQGAPTDAIPSESVDRGQGHLPPQRSYPRHLLDGEPFGVFVPPANQALASARAPLLRSATVLTTASIEPSRACWFVSSLFTGKLVVAGHAGRGVWDTQFALARYGPDGVLDAAFSEDGRTMTDFGNNDEAVAVALQDDGKIVSAGITGPIDGGRDFASAWTPPRSRCR